MKNLFKSKISYEILDLLTQNQGKSFYLSEISQKLDKDPANITRELTKLVSDGVVKLKKSGQKKYYEFDKNSNLSDELINLFNKDRENNFARKFDKQWLLAEELKNTDPFFYQIFANCFVDEFFSPGGRAYKEVISIHKGYNLWFYYDKKDANDVGEHLVNKFESSPEFMKKVNEKIYELSDKLRAFSAKLPENDLKKVSSKKLWEFYKTHEEIHTEYYQWGWIPVAADMFCDNLTNRGKEILRDAGVKENQISQYLVILTQPEKLSLIKIEEQEFAKIGVKVQTDKEQFKLFKELFRKFKEEDVKQFGLYTHGPEYEKKFDETVRKLKNKIRPDILDDLQNHYTKYFYTKFLFTEMQGIYNFEHYLKLLVRLVNHDPNIAGALEHDKRGFKLLAEERQQAIRELKLNKKIISFFDNWGEFMITKIYRRYAQIFAIYRMTPVLAEMAIRLGLKLKEIKFMTSEEIYKALFKNGLNREEIRERTNFCVYYTAKNERGFYVDDKAKKMIKYIEKDKIEKISEIKGQCGARGYVKGKVKIINEIKDMAKMEKGDILVSISTQPDLLPAMKKAAAFVTDQGGVTSHAAIVAREINMPCVIGTKIATKVLKDGDIVEVDADKGIVRILK
jgi:phosphohistidine swiveling domain-containing protein/DNA-binding transcriptional ArsR family regulator